MCTAISFKAKNHYFGRNLDLEFRYDEKVTITPRNFELNFKSTNGIKNHYAIVGMATVVDNYPLYYDGTNDRGLSVAALNFVGNASWNEKNDAKINLSPFEMIPYILSKCASVEEVLPLLNQINIVDIPFNKTLENSQLHWMISDENESIVLECVKDGLKIHKNPTGVLTNNPPFEYQMMNLNNYMGLSNGEAKNKFSSSMNLKPYSRGMGALGLPGDLSSQSRFVRTAFTLLNSVKPQDDIEGLTQAFHILNSVEQQEGCVVFDGKFERTQYTSCCDTNRGIYYYKTYENNQINAVDMFKENLDSKELISYELSYKQQIRYIN